MLHYRQKVGPRHEGGRKAQAKYTTGTKKQNRLSIRALECLETLQASLAMGVSGVLESDARGCVRDVPCMAEEDASTDLACAGKSITADCHYQ